MKPILSACLFSLLVAPLFAQLEDELPLAAVVEPFAANTNAPAVAEAANTNAPASAASSSAYQMRPYEYYHAIVERMPFGKGVAPITSKSATPDDVQLNREQQALASKIHMQAIVLTPDGRTAVGFSDKAASPEKFYYLTVGDSRDGFTVTSADFLTDTATIDKDGTPVTLKLGSGLVETSAPATPAASIAPTALAMTTAPSRVVTPTINRPPMPPLPQPVASRFDPEKPEDWPLPTKNLTAIDKMLEQGMSNSSYRERLEQRRVELLAERAALEAADAKAMDEAAEERAADMFLKMMKRKNLDMIRNGEGSLGIPLTPEEDAMLTAEGVLPVNN